MSENFPDQESSFFEDRFFQIGETNKNNNKEISKNSSNPEKIYEKLNNEIKRVTENQNNNSSNLSSNSNSRILERPLISEKLLESKYWTNNKENKINVQQFTNKFKTLKKKDSDIDEFNSDELDENLSNDNEIIHKISSINIQSNNNNFINNNSTVDSSILNKENNNRIICVTEPEELMYFQNPNINNQSLFKNSYTKFAQIGSFVSTNYPSLNKGSFISNYQNNNNMELNENNIHENKEFNEGIENYGINSCQNYCPEFRARIPNSDLYESKYNNFPMINNVYTIPSLNIKEQNIPNKNIDKMNTNNSNIKASISYKKNSKIIHFPKTENKGEKQIINIDNIINGKDNRTTLMIRNIPIKYTDEKLIEELESFKGKFDCLYMPYDFEKDGNKGYAFINLIHPYHILLFHEKFQNKSWTYFESKKICELNCANFQGINDIQKHAKNYKGIKKPIYFKDANITKTPIEVPLKYLKKVKERFPKLSYYEKKNQDIFVIKCFE